MKKSLIYVKDTNCIIIQMGNIENCLISILTIDEFILLLNESDEPLNTISVKELQAGARFDFQGGTYSDAVEFINFVNSNLNPILDFVLEPKHFSFIGRLSKNTDVRERHKLHEDKLKEEMELR